MSSDLTSHISGPAVRIGIIAFVAEDEPTVQNLAVRICFGFGHGGADPNMLIKEGKFVGDRFCDLRMGQRLSRVFVCVGILKVPDDWSSRAI